MNYKIKMLLDQKEISLKDVSQAWGISRQATEHKLNGTRSISLEQAIILADMIYQEDSNRIRLIRTLSEIKKEKTVVKELIDHACNRSGVNYKELPGLLGLSNELFNHRIMMKVKFQPDEMVKMSELFYSSDSERFAFIKKLMEISQ